MRNPSAVQTIVALALSVALSVEAFSPSSYPSLSASQLDNESQRFTPMAMDDDADDLDLDLSLVDDSPVEEDYIVNVGDLESEDDEDVGVEDDGEIPAWAQCQQRMDALRQQYRLHDKDTGSPEYQVAGMTERIRYLTDHLRAHPKDYSTRRGLVAMVNKRRRLLNYLYNSNVERYKAILKSLGIRHKAPGAVATRAETYGRYPKQKAIKKHLVKKRK